MRLREFKSAAICFAALLVACMARAAAIDRETCFKETGHVAIAACTRLIESGESVGNGLAAIYFNRGVASSKTITRRLSLIRTSSKLSSTVAMLLTNMSSLIAPSRIMIERSR